MLALGTAGPTIPPSLQTRTKRAQKLKTRYGRQALPPTRRGFGREERVHPIKGTALETLSHTPRQIPRRQISNLLTEISMHIMLCVKMRIPQFAPHSCPLPRASPLHSYKRILRTLQLPTTRILPPHRAPIWPQSPQMRINESSLQPPNHKTKTLTHTQLYQPPSDLLPRMPTAR